MIDLISPLFGIVLLYVFKSHSGGRWDGGCAVGKRELREGHSGGEEVADEDAGFHARQLCVRKHEAEERDEPLMLFSSSPGGGVEVGVLEPLLIWSRKYQPGVQYVT